MQWDVFISHAAEDKDGLARPLAQALQQAGLRVWFDDFTIRVGDSLHRSIEDGLAHSQYGVVILSPHYFEKEWAQKELDAMTALERSGRRLVLPVWHNMDADAITARAPILADRRAVLSRFGLEHVVTELLRAIRPDAAELSRPTMAETTMANAPSSTSPSARFLNLLRPGNGRPYAGIAIGAVPEQSGPLEEEQLDIGEAWFRHVNPNAERGVGVPEALRWHVPGGDGAMDLWQAELLPGPIAGFLANFEGKSVKVDEYTTGVDVPLQPLVQWWTTLLAQVPMVFRKLGCSTVVVGFSLQAAPSGLPQVVDIDFDNLPRPHSRGVLRYHSMWRHAAGPFPVDELPMTALTTAVASLLRHFDYGRLDDTIAALGLPLTEIYKVLQMVPVFPAPDARNPDSSVHGVMLEVRSAAGSLKERRVHPVTRSYEPGSLIEYAWNMERLYPPMWYRDPYSGRVERAWERSPEFVGDETTSVKR